MSKIRKGPECETQSEEQSNREIPGKEKSSVKSSSVIDGLQPKDLKSNEDGDQSCKK